MENKIIHKRSSTIIDGKAKLPEVEQLEYGEIAINYADGVETIAFKNDNDEIVEIKSNEYFEQVIKDNELVTAAALTNLDQRINFVKNSVNESETQINGINEILEKVQDNLSNYVTDDELSQKGFLVGEETSDELDDIETNTYVKYLAQTLTEEQQKQARKNIGIGEVSSMNYDLNVKAINHRGYSSEAPENTIPAYIMSKQKGFTYVEADVAFTKDNVSVLLHDLTIDRTSNGSGNIKDLTYEQVLQYDFGSWKSQAYKGVKIATFKEFIVLCKRLGLHPYIELKSSDNYTQEQITQIVKEVDACGMNGKVTYISFYAKYLRYVKDVDQISRLGFVVTSITSGAIDAVLELNTGKNEVFIDASLKNLDDDDVQLCIESGIPLEVWTVNKEADIINMPSYICGVTSDELIAGKVLYNQGLNYVPPISDYVPTESITLSQSSLSFNNRESQTIEAILEPSNASSKVEWSTSDSNIAIVENGVVTPTNDGTCTITAISDDKSASCDVNVDFIKYSITSQLLGCSLNNTLDKVVIDDSYTTEITPDNGYSLKNGEVSVLMGGIDITSSSYNNGMITINNVNGDISITVTCMEVPVYNITRNLIGCTSNKDITSIGEGNPYSETFTPIEGFKLNDATVSITMGGINITSMYINNTLSISEVTGDIVINITAVEVPVYSITRNLTNCTSDKDVTAIREGETYIETLTASDGYTLSNATVHITMGGDNITSSSYNNGMITINNVSGDIIINASAAEFDGLLVDLDLVNVGEDGIVRNLGAGGSAYNTVVSKPKANDSFSASSSGLTLGNHAYVNVPYEFNSTDSFSIICKGRIKTDSSNPYQRLFRTNNDAPSWFIRGTTAPTIKLAGVAGSIEILNDLAAKVSANNAIWIESMDRNQMNEITITCDGSIIKCYFNGILVASQPSTSMKASTAIGIGDNDSSKSYYATEIEVERFAIYNRCLTMES